MSRRQLAAVLVAISLGLAMGLGLFTFGYARGASYLTDDPSACANCHVMNEHYSAWLKSSHRTVAACNDCHAPHNLVGKYLVKAENGFWHSLYFTTGTYTEPLRIRASNHRVTEGACRYCHADIVEAIDPAPRLAAAGAPAELTAAVHAGVVQGTPTPGVVPRTDDKTRTSCIRCHVHVGHWVR